MYMYEPVTICTMYMYMYVYIHVEVHVYSILAKRRKRKKPPKYTTITHIHCMYTQKLDTGSYAQV